MIYSWYLIFPKNVFSENNALNMNHVLENKLAKQHNRQRLVLGSDSLFNVHILRK